MLLPTISMSQPVRKPKSIYTQCHVKFYLIGKQNGEGFHGQLNYCVEVVESNYHSHHVYLLG